MAFIRWFIPIAVVFIAGWVGKDPRQGVPRGARPPGVRIDATGGSLAESPSNAVAFGPGGSRRIVGDDFGNRGRLDDRGGEHGRGGTGDGHGHGEEIVEGDHDVCSTK